MLLRLVLVVPCLTALAGCRVPSVDPVDATDPAPLLGAAAGTDSAIEFRIDAEPDDAAPAAARLSLADAVRASLAHDPGVQQALAKWHRARAASDEARLLPNPVLSVGFLVARALSDASVTVGITQEVAAYLQRPHRAGAADARFRAAAEEAFVAALDAVSEARTAYLAVQAADAKRPAVEQRRELIARLRDVHRASLAEREGFPSDVTALDAEIAAIDVDLAELDAERTRARIELALRIGSPADAGAWTVDAWPDAPADAGDARPWIDRALARRPEIRAIGWELAALGAERDLVATWPWDGAAVGAEIEVDEGLALGPNVAIPLRLVDPSGPRTAALDAMSAEQRHRAAEVRRTVIRDVRLALADEAAARRALDLLERGLLPLLERRRAEIDAAKRVGEVEIALLLLADRELDDARGRRVDLVRRVLDARIRLERAAGGPGDVPSPPSGPQDPRSEGTPR